MADQPPQQRPRQEAPEAESSGAGCNHRRRRIAGEAQQDEHPPGSHDLAGERQIGPPRHLNAGHRPAIEVRSAHGAGMISRCRRRTAALCRASPRAEDRSTAGCRHIRRCSARPPRGAHGPPDAASRRPRGARRQARDFAGPLPVGHALGPDQRVRRDRAPGDQVAKLDLGIWALLLALGCIKPGSSRHFILSPRLAAATRQGSRAPAPKMPLWRTIRAPVQGAGARPQMFSHPCNFFVPFAQKDARFGQAQIT